MPEGEIKTKNNISENILNAVFINGPVLQETNLKIQIIMISFFNS